MWSDRRPGAALRAAFPRLEARPAEGCLVIGEVAQAHDGSLGMAHSFIDAIARAGADAVKFQTHIADAESTPREPWRVRFSPQDATRFDYWKRMEFTEEQWAGLAQHAEEKGLWFLSSPFSMEAVELLDRVGVAAWKIASGETGNVPLLSRIARDGRAVLLSTGMSPLAEVDAAHAIVSRGGREVAVMQCTSSYPCPPEKVGLNVVPALQARYGGSVGLSDHSGTIWPGIAGAAHGIDVLEVHVTLSREMFGPDVPVSLTPGELAALVKGIRFVERMNASPVDKDALAEELDPLRKTFTKSVVASDDLAAGTVLAPEHLALKKPGNGIPAARLHELLGARLLRDLAKDELVKESDVAITTAVELAEAVAR